jgi:hypothetical protein
VVIAEDPPLPGQGVLLQLAGPVVVAKQKVDPGKMVGHAAHIPVVGTEVGQPSVVPLTGEVECHRVLTARDQ